jgi:hypothetical protein
MEAFGKGFGGCLGVFVAGLVLVFFLFLACSSALTGALSGGHH